MGVQFQVPFDNSTIHNKNNQFYKYSISKLIKQRQKWECSIAIDFCLIY